VAIRRPAGDAASQTATSLPGNLRPTDLKSRHDVPPGIADAERDERPDCRRRMNAISAQQEEKHRQPTRCRQKRRVMRQRRTMHDFTASRPIRLDCGALRIRIDERGDAGWHRRILCSPAGAPCSA
jgi:hypothetical protein